MEMTNIPFGLTDWHEVPETVHPGETGIARWRTRQFGAIWLEGENWIQDGLAICGTNGWYEYSGRDPSAPFTDESSFRPLVIFPFDWPFDFIVFS